MNLKFKIAILEKYPSQFKFTKDVEMSDSKISGIIHGRVKPTEAEIEIFIRKLEKSREELGF